MGSVYMSVDRNIFVGLYLKMDKINLSRDVEERGCATCKTSSKDNFCSKCGSPNAGYTRSEKVMYLYDLAKLDVDQNIITDEQYDDMFDSIRVVDNMIIPLNDSVAGKSRYVYYDVEEISFFEIDEAAAKDFYRPVIEMLDRYNVSYEIKRGVAYFLT